MMSLNTKRRVIAVLTVLFLASLMVVAYLENIHH